MEFGAESGLVLGIYGVLVGFGTVYNLLIHQLEERGYLEGFTSLAVALGVLVTVGLMAVVNWRWSLLMIGAFCCSGIPMVAGQIWRYVRRREAMTQSLGGIDEQKQS